MDIVVGCAILLGGGGLTVYGILVGERREAAAVAVLRTALEQWADLHGADGLREVPDPVGDAPEGLPRRMDRVLLARAGRRRGGGPFTAVAYVEDDGEHDHHLLLVSLDTSVAATTAPAFSGPLRYSRWRWARRLATALALDAADARALVRAAAGVDGMLYVGDGRLAVLHYGPLDSERTHDLLDSAARLADVLARSTGRPR